MIGTSNTSSIAPTTSVADTSFDSDLNTSYHAKYDNQSDIVSNVLGGTVATVADFGASVWNSLPGTSTVDTKDILSAVSDNALRVYDENPDTIHTLSFLGGSFLPTGLALKGMALARAGAKGVTWFSAAGRASQLAKIDGLVAEGAQATTEYRAARLALYKSGLANQVLDAAAMETALVLSMNAHPEMEDYMKDPVKNFGIGLAIGGTLGGVIGHIGDRYAIGKAVSAVESQAVKTVTDDLTPAYEGAQAGTRLQIHSTNIGSLDNIIQQGPLFSSPQTIQIANKMKTGLQDEQLAIFNNMMGDDLTKLPKDTLDELFQRFSTSTAFTGVNKVGTVKSLLEDEVASIGTRKDGLKAAPTFSTVESASGVTSYGDSVFYPEFGLFGNLADVKHYGRANALGKSADQLASSLGTNFGRVPNTDSFLELGSKSAPRLDADYLGALVRVDQMSTKELKNLVVAPDDMPLLNAVAARYAKNPDAFDGISFKVTSNAPNYGVVQEAVAKAGGVKPSHFDDIGGLLSDNTFDLGRTSPGVKEITEGWIDGSANYKAMVRDMVDKVQRTGIVHLGESSGSEFDKVHAMLYSDQRKAFQQALLKSADAEGNVYLWRGISKDKAVGHSSVESYSPSYEIAKEFGTPKLYKVAVDDVIGAITSNGEKEILVGSPARQVEASLPVSTGSSKAFAASSATSVTEEGAAQLADRLNTLKGESISSLLSQGVPLESIAVRTNTPLETVQAFAAAPEGAGLANLGITSTYRVAADASTYLNPAQQPLRLSSDIRKTSYAALASGLDVKASADIHRGIMSTSLAASPSATAQEIGRYFFTNGAPSESSAPLLDILRAQVSNFVNSAAGSKLWQSTDFYGRNFKEAGMIASVVGKDVSELANKAITRILNPIREQMAVVAKDEVALIEANTALQVNASLKGWRTFQDGQFFQKQLVQNEAGIAVETLVPATFQGGEFKVVSKSTQDLLSTLESQGRELYNLKNTSNRILGIPDLTDLGFWSPAFNPKNKFISYVHRLSDDTTQILWGNTAEELASAERAFKATVPANQLGSEIRVITKSSQAAENRISGYDTLSSRVDPLTSQIANTSLQHTGASAAAVVKSNADIFSEIAGGYEHHIQAQVKNLAELSMHDITDVLDRMSAVNRNFHDEQALTGVAKLLSVPEDAANVMKNTLLGNSNLNQYAAWQTVNQSFATGLNLGVRAVEGIFGAALAPLRKTWFGKDKELTAEVMKKLDYADISDKLKAAGVVNPWAAFDTGAAELFGLSKISDSKDISGRIVGASNALAATVMLRVGELAQPIVNALSLPILTSLAVSNRMPETFMGVAKATSNVGLAQVMHDGIRAQFNPAFAALGKRWEDLGYFTPLVSEATEVLKLARGFEKGAIAKVEGLLDSKLVAILSKGADFSEGMVRRQTMFTGAVLAKRLYPELSDAGVTIFARDFMDKAVGNYNAAQRPVFFQGTLGTAMGLFQTYMLAMGQAVYRHLELKDYKALGKAALLQTGLFGAGSLPGFHQVSEAIGEHYSDHHMDLQTGTYRAIGNTAADFLLYGFPSNLGPAVYTRGDIAPRVPNPLGGLQNLAAVNVASQTVDMINQVRKGLSADYPDVARTMGEALSMQSISRPVARMSELATGYSVTRRGNTISVPEEVWTPMGIISRVLGTRPIGEAKLREAIHLNTFYGSVDRDAREEVTNKLRTAIRGGTVTDESVAKLAEEYFHRGGTPSGWNSAKNTAIAKTDLTGKATLVEKLNPESPLNFMIDNLD